MAIRTHKQTEKYYSRALLDTTSIVETDTGERFFSVVFATETPVFRRGWDENFNEILLCDRQYMRTGRLDENAVPLLDNHDKYSGVKGQFGSVVSYDIQNRECRATLRFSARRDLDGVWSDIKAGIVKSISVGYNVYKYIRETNAEDKAIPNYSAADWEPLEISLAPVPADFRSKIRAEDEGHNIVIENLSPIQNNIRNMDEETTVVEQTTTPANDAANRNATQPAAPVTVPATDNSAQARAAGAREERERVVAIGNAVRAARLSDSFGQMLVENGSTVDTARAAILDELARTSVPASGGPAASARGDEGENRRAHMVEGLMHRAMPGSVKKMVEQARDYQHVSLIGLARQCLDVSGDRSGRYSDNEVITRAFATTDFPDLLSNATQRFLRHFYEAENFDWKKLAKATTNKDFRTRTGLAVDGKVTFEKVAENGSFKQSTIITNEKATTKLQTYGHTISVGRQAIINDDLGVFNELPRIIAQGAANLQSKMFWDLITTNAKAPDGKAIFHADHANLAAVAGAPSAGATGTLSAARTALWRQKTPAGEPMPVKAKYLVVPAELQTTAEQLMTSIMANETAKVNGFAGQYEIVVDPHLTDPNAWYLAADPAQVEGIVYAYLSGQEGLNIESSTDKKTLNVDTIAFLDFDAAVWGYRGWYKNAGV